MNEMELLVHLHRNYKRQGSGSDETTNLSLALAGLDNDKSYKIADIGLRYRGADHDTCKGSKR